jgi:hypothetical protein
MRLFAFILLAIGIRIMWGGTNELLLEVIKELPVKSWCNRIKKWKTHTPLNSLLCLKKR